MLRLLCVSRAGRLWCVGAAGEEWLKTITVRHFWALVGALFGCQTSAVRMCLPFDAAAKSIPIRYGLENPCE